MTAALALAPPVPVEEISGPLDRFRCLPFSATLLARACVEKRRAFLDRAKTPRPKAGQPRARWDGTGKSDDKCSACPVGPIVEGLVGAAVDAGAGLAIGTLPPDETSRRTRRRLPVLGRPRPGSVPEESEPADEQDPDEDEQDHAREDDGAEAAPESDGAEALAIPSSTSANRPPRSEAASAPSSRPMARRLAPSLPVSGPATEGGKAEAMPRSYTCRACGKPGHNRRQCPKIGGERPRRQAAKREEYFSPRSPNVHVAGAPKARGKTARSRGAEPRNISPNPAQSEAIVGALRAGMKNLVGGLVGMLESWRKDGDKIREEIIARMAALDEERSALVAAMDFLARLKAGPGHEISAVGAENWRVVQDRFDQGVAASEPKAKPDAQAAPHDKSARVLAALNKRGASSVKQIAAATKLDEKAVRYALWRLRAKHFVFCAGARDDARWAVSKKEAKAANAVAVAARRASAG